jgi:hypothetical protein
MTNKNAFIGLLGLTAVFVAALYLFAYSDYSKPTQPQYDFVYTTYDFMQEPRFDVNGRIIETEKSKESIINTEEKDKYGIEQYNHFGKTYLYDTQSKTSKELTKDEYQSLDKLVEDEAPDGYKFQDYYKGGFIVPFSNTSGINNLEKDGYTVSTDINYNNSVIFVAWVDNK